MWPFGKNAKENQYQHLLAQARQCLNRFPPAQHDHRSGRWYVDATSVPLEFRQITGRNLSRLAEFVAGANDPELREDGWADQGEIIQVMVQLQALLVPFPRQDLVVRCRAVAYGDIFGELVVLLERCRASPGDEDIIMRSQAYLVEHADEALSWFPTEKDLVAARKALLNSRDVANAIPRATAVVVLESARRMLVRRR